MGAFDGIDPVQQEAIRRALSKEVKREVAEELRDDIRRRVEEDVRAETRQAVLQEIAERAPTAGDRERFTDYVNEVRLDAYAQATLASDIADAASVRVNQSRKWMVPVYGALLLMGPLFAEGWPISGRYLLMGVAVALALLAMVATRAWRHASLDGDIAKHRKIASDFLIIAERAKAYAMVHAERHLPAAELHELIEGLRRDKERQDRAFHPSAASLETARDEVRARFRLEARPRIAVDEDADEDEEQLAAPRKRRRTS